ncbi:MAG: hemerythrin family protein, partial [Rhodoferax sp.]|nr:hemerythrin family protein [Rhodoferax sp.]
MGLQWREQLSVGNDLIDADHQRLIEIINLAEHSLRTVNRGELIKALDQLFKYAQVHFVLEEKIATAVGYPEIARIHASHQALLTRLTQVTREIGAHWDAATAEHFGSFLREWLVNHVIKEDMLLKP